MFSDLEKRELIKYAIASIYKTGEFFFTLSAPDGFDVNDCVIIGTGCKNVAKVIRNLFNSDKVTNPDQLHEIMSCARVLNELSYPGMIICFVGGIKASLYKKTEKLDELDGFIYFPTRAPKESIAIIVEAKNYSCGCRDAEKQLSDSMKFLSETLTATVTPLEKCAYMNIKIKD